LESLSHASIKALVQHYIDKGLSIPLEVEQRLTNTPTL